MSAYHYGITSPLQHLDKARYELEQLRKLQDAALSFERSQESGYLAATLASTLWHITDAVFASDDTRFAEWRAKNGVNNLQVFQEQMRQRSQELKLCWKLCNGSKHIRKHPDAEVEVTTMSLMPSATVAFPPAWFPKKKYRPNVKIKATGEKHRSVGRRAGCLKC